MLTVPQSNDSLLTSGQYVRVCAMLPKMISSHVSTNPITAQYESLIRLYLACDRCLDDRDTFLDVPHRPHLGIPSVL